MQSNLIKIIGVCFSIFILSGCTAKITAENVSPNVNFENRFDYTVQVKTDGGREKDPLGMPEISNKILYDSVFSTLKSSQLFKNVVESNGEFLLELYVVQVGQPVAGSSMTVNVEIAWALKQKDEILWKKSIRTTSTKTMQDEGGAFNRMVEATIAATKKNIQKGLVEIAELKL